MQNLKILNKKEIKNILKLIKKQWDCDIKLDYAFLQNEKNKVFIVNKEISNIDLDNLRINSLGIYFATMAENTLRLSIEGSQIIGPNAKKNILRLNEEETKQWLKGIDLEKDNKEKGFLIIKNNNDFLGCGKAVEKKILNYVPKARRINVID